MKNLIRTIIVALFIVSTNICLSAQPPLETVQKAKTMVENARPQLPFPGGYGLLLTELSYDSKTYSLVYRYRYTVPATKPTNKAIKESKQSLILLLKSHPDSEDMKFLKDGITYYYNYYSQQGDFLFAVKITPDAIK